MSLDAGDAACTHGLSGRIYANWLGDATNGFSGSLTAGQTAALKSTCYQQAISIVAEVQADYVSADAYTTAGQSIPSVTYTAINFGSVVSDPFSAITTGAGWKFTCPSGKGGTYLVSASLTFGSVFAANDVLTAVFKNGSMYRRFGPRAPAASGITARGGSIPVPMAAGDYLDVRIYQNSGSNQALEALADGCWVSIAKLVGS